MLKTRKQDEGKGILDALKAIYPDLPEAALVSLCEFGDFLCDKHPVKPQPIAKLIPIERPATESVIAAIKRLSKTYPMLDKKILFEQTSAAMSAHVMHEVSTEASIDHLEAVFRKEYDALFAQD